MTDATWTSWQYCMIGGVLAGYVIGLVHGWRLCRRPPPAAVLHGQSPPPHRRPLPPPPPPALVAPRSRPLPAATVFAVRRLAARLDDWDLCTCPAKGQGQAMGGRPDESLHVAGCLWEDVAEVVDRLLPGGAAHG